MLYLVQLKKRKEKESIFIYMLLSFTESSEDDDSCIFLPIPYRNDGLRRGFGKKFQKPFFFFFASYSVFSSRAKQNPEFL